MKNIPEYTFPSLTIPDLLLVLEKAEKIVRQIQLKINIELNKTNYLPSCYCRRLLRAETYWLDQCHKIVRELEGRDKLTGILSDTEKISLN